MAQMSFSLAAADMIALVNWYGGGLFSIGSMRAFGFLFWRGGSTIGMVKERKEVGILVVSDLRRATLYP